MKASRIVMMAVAVGFVGIQFVPVDRTNPPVEKTIDAPAAVRDILERACYDCHSNLTQWPWYGYVAPVSWLVAHDVHEGREELNFSAWNRLSPERKAKKIWEVGEEIAEGEMPLRLYRWMHSHGRLSEAERTVLIQWAKTNGREDEKHEHEQGGD